MKKRKAYNAINWTDEMLDFLRDNYQTMTNPELADHLGLKLTSVRMKLYAMGYKRMEMEYWAKEQIQFLKDHYREIGDVELAEIFEVKWHKAKGWSKKHIEKKRRYLKLKRTKAEIAAIKLRNTKMGRFSECAKKRWETTGQAEIGEKRVWFSADHHPFVVIKQKKGFVSYNRWLWQLKHGRIPKGMNVVVVGRDRINYTIDDLKLMTNAELTIHNIKKRIPKELRETRELIRKLNKKIEQHEHH